MQRLLLATLGVVAVSLVAPRTHACGAVVTSEKSLVVQAQQRVLISLRSDDTSHVVVELAIPSADAPFGALTPVGAQPTLDPDPIDVEELAALERATRPSIAVEQPASDGGCGCYPSVAGGSAGDRGGVNVVQTVDIGPVTAAVLTADTAAPLTQWLADNGFVIPSAEQVVVDAYAGPGQFFIAFKRSAQATAGPSSVGVGFSVFGDLRGYPLRMSRIGAASRLAIQVFVAAPAGIAPDGSAPSAPFAALTLADFSPHELANDYGGAIFDRVAARSSKAFVVEGVFRSSEIWRSSLGPKLTSLTESGQVLTRLATVVAPATLDRDVVFLDAAPDNVPTRIIASASAPHAPVPRAPQPFTLALLGVCAGARSFRRALRRNTRSARQ